MLPAAPKSSSAFPTTHTSSESLWARSQSSSIIFGPNSTVCQVLRGWGSHIREHEILYAQQMRADRTFGCKILALIDRAIQLYFRACLDEDNRTSAARHLMFDRYQSEIIMNTFTYTTLPTIIAHLISQKSDTLSFFLGLSSPNPHTNGPKLGSTPVFNLAPYPSFKATPTQVRQLLNTLSTAPTWSHGHPPCQPCPKYLSGSACVAECPRAATHRSPRADEIAPYIQWLQTRGRASHPTDNPSGTPGGRKPRRPTPNPDSTGGTPKRPRSSGHRVQFAEDGKMSDAGDF